MPKDLSTLMTLQENRDSSLWSQKLSVASGTLHVVEGPHKGSTLSFDEEIILVGRSSLCALSLSEDRKVSKEHCELLRTPDGVKVRDLGSSNGVFVDHVRVLEGFLAPGSILKVGHSQIKLETDHQQQEIALHHYDGSQQLVGQSPAMRKLFAMLSRLSMQDIPVLLTGETGTGKTTIAHALHAQSQRKSCPFVPVNCGALPHSLLEALLFGYEKGAFTGASTVHRGFFEQADKGTLFLDEIGELPLELQPKLLDVLESGRIQRLGSETSRTVDVRLVTSTLRNLGREVEQGGFRRDLYYRLAVVELEVPPLRQRTEDIPLLIEWLLPHIAPGRHVTLLDGAMLALQDYLWPGNVRQLRNVLERLLALLPVQDDMLFVSSDQLCLPPTEAFLEPFQTPSLPTLSMEHSGDPFAVIWEAHSTLKELLVETEKQVILLALQQVEYDVPVAAELLDISRVWLYKRIKKYDLPLPRYKRR